MTESLQLTPRQIEAAGSLASLLWQTSTPDEALARYAELAGSQEAKKRRAEWRERAEIDAPLAEARELMLPGLLDIEGRFCQIVRQWPFLFWRGYSKMDAERSAEMRYTGLAQIQSYGSHPVHDSEAGEERYVYQIENCSIGLSARIRRQMVDDGAHLGEIFAHRAIGLAESCHQSEEILHANVFNAGNVYNPSLMGDGCPLFYDKHPQGRGVYSNVCDDELSEDALEKMALSMRRLQDSAGLLVFARPRKLVIPAEMEFAAERLRKAMEGNPAWPCEGYQVLDFLTNPKAWFVTTTIRGLRSYERHPFKLDFSVDKGDLILEATQSYGMGHTNPRACFASYPKSPA